MRYERKKCHLLLQGSRDHSGYGISQREEVLLCNTSSHWPNPYPEWFLWQVNMLYIRRIMNTRFFCFVLFAVVWKWSMLCTSFRDISPGQSHDYLSASKATLTSMCKCTTSLWRYNDRNGVSNRQRLDDLPNRLFKRRSNIKVLPRQWPLWGEPRATGGFPSQRTSHAENVSIWWRHHEIITTKQSTSKQFAYVLEYTVMQ